MNRMGFPVNAKGFGRRRYAMFLDMVKYCFFDWLILFKQNVINVLLYFVFVASYNKR